jgi:hypothetical protein
VRASRVPWWGDLTAVAGLAVAGLVGALIPLPEPVRMVALLPLALVVPGYAVAAALFRPGEISSELRAVLSVAFSIGEAVLGGLAVQLVLPLDRAVWAATLALTTLLAVAIALDRRDTMPADSGEPKVKLPRVSLAAVAAMLAAMAIAGWGIALATDGVHRQLARAHFTSLSLVPGGSSPASQGAEVGVLNHEGSAAAYRLTVRQGSRTIGSWRLRLEPDQNWRSPLVPSAISGGAPVVARLDRGGVPYRRASLSIAGGA